MTLSTHIVVKDSVPVLDLFRYCQSLLGDPDSQSWEHTKCDGSADEWEYGNHRGQGLLAWLTVRHGQDAETQFFSEHTTSPRWRGSVVVTFDTGYGFRGPHGADCGDLHAYLVACVARWLEERGATYEWEQESMQAWFTTASPHRLAHLGDPGVGALCCLAA